MSAFLKATFKPGEPDDDTTTTASMVFTFCNGQVPALWIWSWWVRNADPGPLDAFMKRHTAVQTIAVEIGSYAGDVTTDTMRKFKGCEEDRIY